MIVALCGQFALNLEPCLKERSFEVEDIDQITGSKREADVKAIVTRGKLTVNEALLDRFPSLRIIVKAGSGLDTIDLEAANAREILVKATFGSEESVADLAMALLFSCLRHIHIFHPGLQQGRWELKDQLIGTTLRSRRIGVVGFGRIGQLFASMASDLNASVFVWDHSVRKAEKLDLARRIGAQVCSDLDDLIRSCDVVSLHLPFNAKTDGMIGSSQFALMNLGTILVNTARAAIVDQHALLKALTEGPLSAAGLDVHYVERSGGLDPLHSLPNVVLTPHVGAQCVQAQQAIAERIVCELEQFFDVSKVS